MVHSLGLLRTRVTAAVMVPQGTPNHMLLFSLLLHTSESKKNCFLFQVCTKGTSKIMKMLWKHIKDSILMWIKKNPNALKVECSLLPDL